MREGANSKIYGTSHFISFMQCIYLYLVYFYFNRKILLPYVCKQRRKYSFVCLVKRHYKLLRFFGAGGIKSFLILLITLVGRRVPGVVL